MSTLSDDQAKVGEAPNGSAGQPQQPSSETPLAPASDGRRTTIFVVLAIVSLLVTVLFEYLSRPAEIAEYGKVGEEFYPEFDDPTVATSLVVKAVDDNLRVQEFSVQQADSGRWVIPSHHDYPADAEDQLAETAASVIGIERKAMVSRWPSDHVRFGVVDPETDSVGVSEMEGLGKRLTLRGADDTVLASFIIGEKVEDAENEFYVRHPDEDEIYIAELDIDLSTRFSDWVDTELLGIDNFELRKLVLLDYSFQERGPAVELTQTEVSTLTRESSDADWQLAELEDESKEVNSQAVTETVNTIADLEIIGVRPKQPGLTADLKLDRSVVTTQRDLERIQSDLVTRGFILQPVEGDSNQLKLLAREGEISVGTEDALLYNLHFGRAFTGTNEELETGLSSTDEEDGSTEQADDEEQSDEQQTEEDGGSDNGSESDSTKPGRYVFIRVEVEPSLLGEKPEPVEPEKPAELVEAEAEGNTDDPAGAESDADAAADGDGDGDNAEGDSESSDGEASEAEAEESEEDRLAKLREEYDAAMQQYIDDQRALDEYESKLQQAEEKAEELNRRFAQWYYVIPGESYDKLTLSREDLVQEKTAEEDQGAAANREEPMPQFDIGLPTGNPPLAPPAVPTPDDASAEKPSEKGADPSTEEKPAEEPVDDQPSAEEKPAEEEPAEEEPVEEEPVEEKPASEANESTENKDAEQSAEKAPPPKDAADDAAADAEQPSGKPSDQPSGGDSSADDDSSSDGSAETVSESTEEDAGSADEVDVDAEEESAEKAPAEDE